MYEKAPLAQPLTPENIGPVGHLSEPPLSPSVDRFNITETTSLASLPPESFNTDPSRTPAEVVKLYGGLGGISLRPLIDRAALGINAIRQRWTEHTLDTAGKRMNSVKETVTVLQSSADAAMRERGVYPSLPSHRGKRRPVTIPQIMLDRRMWEHNKHIHELRGSLSRMKNFEAIPRDQMRYDVRREEDKAAKRARKIKHHIHEHQEELRAGINGGMRDGKYVRGPWTKLNIEKVVLERRIPNKEKHLADLRDQRDRIRQSIDNRKAGRTSRPSRRMP